MIRQKQKKQKKKSKLNTIDCILLGCATFLVLFTIAVLIIFIIFQNEPDTLITSVFGLLGGEITLSFAIWYIKKRYAKKYEKEDRVDDTRSIYQDNDSDI